MISGAEFSWHNSSIACDCVLGFRLRLGSPTFKDQSSRRSIAMWQENGARNKNTCPHEGPRALASPHDASCVQNDFQSDVRSQHLRLVLSAKSVKDSSGDYLPCAWLPSSAWPHLRYFGRSLAGFIAMRRGVQASRGLMVSGSESKTLLYAGCKFRNLNRSLGVVEIWPDSIWFGCVKSGMSLVLRHLGCKDCRALGN